MPDLYSKVHDLENLQKAWKHVYQNGLKSSSNETKSSIQTFNENELQNLKKIRRELQQEKFIFEGIKGIGAKKRIKKCLPRPIVLCSPHIRIVQRSILDTLQNQRKIKPFLDAPHSFGAIQNKGVPEAISVLVEAIKNGATHYIKSDIISFFTRIDRSKVIDILFKLFEKESRFIELIKKATDLKIENLNELENQYGKDFKQLFIFSDVGTPQGCPLSPLFGNILLYDFDIKMNQGDIVCLRYLDDFIILGPSLKAVNAAFKRATLLLKALNLEAYNPDKDSDKANRGSLKKPFEFLGIEFQGKNIRPSRKSRKKLLDEIKAIIKKSISLDFSKIEDGSQEEKSFVQTLHQINNKLKGWGNQYYFCNDVALWGSLETELNNLIKRYSDGHSNKMKKLAKQPHRRRQLGVHLLVDSKSKPISW